MVYLFAHRPAGSPEEIALPRIPSIGEVIALDGKEYEVVTVGYEPATRQGFWFGFRQCDVWVELEPRSTQPLPG